MKNEFLTEAKRSELITAFAHFRKIHEFPLSSHQATAEQVHWMSLGAIAFSSWLLERTTFGNLDGLIEAMNGVSR